MTTVFSSARKLDAAGQVDDFWMVVEGDTIMETGTGDLTARLRQATASAQEAQQIFNNRYVGGVDTYLQVITAQTTALTNERNDIDILRRRMEASVLLVKALGGGWDRTQLPPR